MKTDTSASKQPEPCKACGACPTCGAHPAQPVVVPMPYPVYPGHYVAPWQIPLPPSTWPTRPIIWTTTAPTITTTTTASTGAASTFTVRVDPTDPNIQFTSGYAQ